MNINDIIKLSLEEDLGHGDITTEYLELENTYSTAFIIAKQDGVIAGIEIAINVFQMVDSDLKTIIYKKDGDWVIKSDHIMKIEGKTSSILKAERVALNFLQRLSGIATQTRNYVNKLDGLNTKLLDTGKTTPLLRKLEKYAVTIGGGFNHRFGLYDMIMLKENHIRAAKGISSAVAKIKVKNTSYKIEVEVTNLEELKEAVDAGADRALLDNMSIDDMKRAVESYKKNIELEASGNITIENIKEIAETGVHYISSGSLTHSYKSMDISLLFKE